MTMNPRVPIGDGSWSQASGTSFALASMLCFQFGTAWSVPLLLAVGPATATWLRLIGASLVLVTVVRPSIRAHPLRALAPAILLGLAMCGMGLFFAESVTRIDLGMASAIEFLGPITLALAASRRWSEICWGILAAAGVFLLTATISSSSGNAAGIAFALAAALCWAAYIVLTKHVGEAFEKLEGLAIAIPVAALAATPIGFLQMRTETDRWSVGALVVLGLIVPAVPYGLEMLALRRISARAFGVLMSLEPAIAAIAGLVLLDQKLGWEKGLGIACVVAASIGTIVFRRDEKESPPIDYHSL